MSISKETFKEKIKGQYSITQLQAWVTTMPSTYVAKSDKKTFLNKMKQSLDREEVARWVDALPDTPLTAVAPGAPIIEKKQAEPKSAEPAKEEIAIGGPKKKKVPSKYKKGDTLMHPIFRHPYVLLEKKGDSWICGLLTSEPSCAEILEKTDSRFFLEEYFTKVIFTTKDPIGTFMYPFDNPKQIKSILIKLKEIFI